MNASDILRRLGMHSACGPTLIGMYASDTLPEAIEQTPSLHVVNTDIAAGLGIHWVVFYFPGNDEPAEFFDSLGQPPDHYTARFVKFLTNNSPTYKFQRTRIQDFQTHTCGYYCIFYSLHRCNGWSLEDIVDFFDKRPRSENDKIVKTLYS